MYSLASKAGREIGLQVTEASVGGGSDANFVTPLGVPVMDGLGAVGDGAHAVNEHILLESLSLRSALLAGLIRELQSLDEVGGGDPGS
jgi:glutamate carboxypeptidase